MSLYVLALDENANPELHGPFETEADRDARAAELHAESLCFLLGPDAGDRGRLSIRAYEPPACANCDDVNCFGCEAGGAGVGDGEEESECPFGDVGCEGSEEGCHDACDPDHPDNVSNNDEEYEITKDFGAPVLRHAESGKTFGPDDILPFAPMRNFRGPTGTETAASYAVRLVRIGALEDEATAIEFIRRSADPECIYDGARCRVHPGGFSKTSYGKCHLSAGRRTA